MNKAPQALMLTVAGILLTVRGIVTGTLWLNIVGDIVVVVGVILFWHAQDKLLQFAKRADRHGRKVDWLADAQADSDLIARAAVRKADEAKAAAKSKGQHIKGYVREGDRIFNFEDKEKAV